MKNTIVWGSSDYYAWKEGKDFPDWRVTNMFVDSGSDLVTLIFEKGMKVENRSITMETAQEIGFLNFSALQSICPK